MAAGPFGWRAGRAIQGLGESAGQAAFADLGRPSDQIGVANPLVFDSRLQYLDRPFMADDFLPFVHVAIVEVISRNVNSGYKNGAS